MFEELEKYKSLEFFAKQVVEGFVTGLHRSPFHGFSVEFSEHRQYNVGESTRNIDWKLYGRTDKLFVKTYEEETNLRCMLMIDHSSSMLFPIDGQNKLSHPNKLTFSIYASALLIELLRRQRDAFGISLISDHIDLQTPIRSNATHQHYTLQLLEQELRQPIDDKRTLRSTDIIEALHLTAEQLHKRSLVVLFTDAFIKEEAQEPLLDALRHLRHNKHEVLLFHTFDRRHEIEFGYANQPTEFIDLESGKHLKVQPSEVAERYRTLLKNEQKALKQRAIQYKIDYIPVDIAQGFEEIMLQFLIKRSKN